MDFNTLAAERQSIRRFNSSPISDEAITQLLTAAKDAPSAGNCQPWHFYVIKSGVVKRDISAACGQAFIETAPVVFVVCADIPRTTPRYGERGQTLYCLQDTAAAIQNMLLCAETLGLGACWCGAFNEEAVATILGLKNDMRPVAVIPVGGYDTKPSRPKRRELSEITTYITDER